MSATLDLGLAGLHIRVECDEAAYIDEAHQVFGDFRPTEGSEPELTLRIRTTAPVPIIQRQNYPVESELRLGRLHLRRMDQFEGWLNLSAGEGEFKVQKRGMRDLARSWTSGMNSMLRVCSSILVQRRGGAMLHASGVALDGHGYVFTGVSGAGKTTISRLAPDDARVVGDDLVLITPDLSAEGPGYWVHGTPFLGEWRGRPDAGPFPIAGLFHIVQSEHNRVGERDRRSARRALLRNLVNFDPSPKAAMGLMDLADALTKHYGGAELEFSLDGGVWPLLAQSQRERAAHDAGAPP